MTNLVVFVGDLLAICWRVWANK